jgi:hypothetical protein
MKQDTKLALGMALAMLLLAVVVLVFQGQLAPVAQGILDYLTGGS